MENLFVLVVLLFVALATGRLIVNWIGLGRAMSRLSVSAYIEFHQHTNRTFDPYMPIVVIAAPAGSAAALAAMYGVHSSTTCRSGYSLLAVVIIIGVRTCVRINHQIASRSIQHPPREWAQIRARWLRFHVIRTLFSVPAFAVYVLASMSNTSRQLS